MKKYEHIHIHIVIKKEEIPDRILNFLKLKTKYKSIFFFGILKILEAEMEKEENKRRKERIEKQIKDILKLL